MTIGAKATDGVLVLTLAGRMVFGESLFQVRGHIQKAIASGTRRFIVDLSGVPFADSSACGELINIHTSISKANGSLTLVNPQERVRVLLSRIGVAEVFKIVDRLEPPGSDTSRQ
jgi:stage II sporulation protein AA (anti-sigma F factor antagonist)